MKKQSRQWSASEQVCNTFQFALCAHRAHLSAAAWVQFVRIRVEYSVHSIISPPPGWFWPVPPPRLCTHTAPCPVPTHHKCMILSNIAQYCPLSPPTCTNGQCLAAHTGPVLYVTFSPLPKFGPLSKGLHLTRLHRLLIWRRALTVPRFRWKPWSSKFNNIQGLAIWMVQVIWSPSWQTILLRLITLWTYSQ